MTYDELLARCLALPGAWPDDPWGDHVVAKVGSRPGKVFAFPGQEAVSLKVDPAEGQELRSAYPGTVVDAPYLSKRHWVSVRLSGDVPDDELAELVEGSYALVVARLPKGQRPAAP